MTTLTVVAAGLHSTVQDLGRWGWARSGVPVAGALDPQSLLAANRAVGNPDDAAGLECVLRGPTLLTDSDASLAVVGAGWALGPVPLAAGVPYTVRVEAGLRCWVAISGGIATEPVLGSRSTDTLSGLGGRVLRDGDVLPLGVAGRPGPSPAPGPALPAGEVVLRVTPGPHADRLGRRLDEVRLTVSSRSDRTGIRFAVSRLLVTGGGDVTTTGVVPGAIQLPPGGEPILLMGNCQTTGGYPVMAVVCSADLRLAAQLRPGAAVRLQSISVGQARELAAQAAF